MNLGFYFFWTMFYFLFRFLTQKTIDKIVSFYFWRKRLLIIVRFERIIFVIKGG